MPVPPRRPRGRFVTAALSSTRLIVISSVVLLLLRLAVLVAEAHAMVVGERTADDELIHLCRSGQARESPHMRTACMQATIDRASPAVIRAVTRGAYLFLNELYTLVSVPFRAIGVASAVALMGVLPWINAVRGFFSGTSHDVHREMAQPEHTVVILQNGDRADALTNASTHRRIACLPSLLEEVDLGTP